MSTPREPIDVIVPVVDEFEKLRLCCMALRRYVPLNHLIISTANISQRSVREVGALADVPVFDESVVGAGATRALGLSRVETEYYGSIDADVIIAQDWYECCMKTLRDPSIAACQGIQKPIGRFADMWLGPLYMSGWHCDQGNTMLRTRAVREVGIPTDIQSEDAVLRSRLLNRGYRWIVNPDITSIHLQTDIDLLRHWFRYGKLDPHDGLYFAKYVVWLSRWIFLEDNKRAIDLTMYKFLAHLSRAVGSLVGQYSR